MPPNQDKTSNGKQIEQIIAHNYFVFYFVFLRVTKINLGDASNEREGVHLHTLEDR